MVETQKRFHSTRTFLSGNVFLLRQGLLGVFVSVTIEIIESESFFLRNDASLRRRAEMVSTSSSCTIKTFISRSTSPVIIAPMRALPLWPCIATNALLRYTLSQTFAAQSFWYVRINDTYSDTEFRGNCHSTAWEYNYCVSPENWLISL